MDMKDLEEFKVWNTADVFPDPIWKAKYPHKLFRLQKKAKEFLDNSEFLNAGLERDGGASSSSDPEQPHMWGESQEFYEWLRNPSEEIWQSWNYQNGNRRQITKSWVNFHPPGAWTDEHTHGNTDMVAVLYLDAPTDSGNLQVHNPLFYHWEGTQRIAGSNSWTNVPIETGDVVIFPGWLLHRTEKNNSTNDRMTINTNIAASVNFHNITIAKPTPADGR
jgi:uncharacterized protein (TIGR02466 family)|tara:strand:+ start:632 stop:1291 length:660 start_codon:yes stop_codon:yes gene_type:complete